MAQANPVSPRHSARGDKICHEPFIHIEIPFIFAEVANGMTFVEHAPYLGTQSEGVRQRLKNDIAIGRPVSMPTQGGQTKRMSGVVGEINRLSSEFEFFAESVNRANADRFNPANSFASGGSF